MRPRIAERPAENTAGPFPKSEPAPQIAESPGPPVARGVSWLLAGNVVYSACSWALLVAAARLGTAETVGRLALAAAVATPVFTFFNLNLRGLLATDALGTYGFRDYVTLRATTTVLALGVVAALAWAGYGGETAAVIVWVGLARGFHSLGEMFQARNLRRGCMGRLAVSLMLRGALTLAALALGLLVGGGLAAGAAGMALASLAVWLVWDVPSSRSDRIEKGLAALERGVRDKSRLAVLRKLAGMALPLGFVVMLISLYSHLPRYFVERFAGEAELGVFAAMAQLKMVGVTVVSAAGQAASPRLAVAFSRGEYREVRRLAGKLLGSAVLLGAGGLTASVLAGDEILTGIYGPAYAGQSGVLVWLMAAAVLEYAASVLGYTMTAARIIRPQLPIAAVVTAVLGAGLYLLVPEHGGLGAAIALLAAMFLDALLCAAAVSGVLRARRNGRTA